MPTFLLQHETWTISERKGTSTAFTPAPKRMLIYTGQRGNWFFPSFIKMEVTASTWCSCTTNFEKLGNLSPRLAKARGLLKMGQRILLNNLGADNNEWKGAVLKTPAKNGRFCNGPKVYSIRGCCCREKRSIWHYPKSKSVVDACCCQIAFKVWMLLAVIRLTINTYFCSKFCGKVRKIGTTGMFEKKAFFSIFVKLWNTEILFLSKAVAQNLILQKRINSTP